MRFLNFALPESPRNVQAGVQVGEQIYPLARLLGPSAAGPIGWRLGQEDLGLSAWREQLERVDFSGADALPSHQVLWYPPVYPAAGFRDFYAFEEHVRNARRRRGLDMVPEWYQFPVFYFSNPHVFRGHEEEIEAPSSGEELDYELEIACIIGKQGENISEEEAEGYIAGYAILNDWSLRDVQRREMRVGLGPAKGKDFATSLGPCLVTPEELEDRRRGKGYDLEMQARRNGRVLSRGNWSAIHYSFAQMIARASRGAALGPGDVLGSGTVGSGCLLELGAEEAGGWLRPGDVVELEVERLGVLRNRVVSRKP